MFRKVTLIFTLFLLVGCKKIVKDDIYTKIEKTDNVVIAINYPITHIKKLDKKIKDDINSIYIDFKHDYYNFNILYEKSELNIDYVYNTIVEKYICITIKININSSSNSNQKNITYLFNKSKNKFIKLNDIVNTSDLSNTIVKHILYEYPSIAIDDLNKKFKKNFYNAFFIDSNFLRLYFDNKMKIKIPLSELDLKINIPKQAFRDNENIKKINIKQRTIDSSKKVIALTFDDGPSKYTNEIINYLNSKDACATFFILGNKVDIYTDTLKEMIKYGNEIGNHSYNHTWLTKLTVNEYKKQIDDTQQIINEKLNYVPILLRPTYGSINKMIRDNTNLKIVLWNIDTRDWKQKSAKGIANEAIKKAYDGAIILMHDTHKRTLEALKIIVPNLKNQGYQFVTVSDLNEVKA